MIEWQKSPDSKLRFRAFAFVDGGASVSHVDTHVSQLREDLKLACDADSSAYGI